MSRRLTIWLTLVVIIVSDQITKVWARETLKPLGVIEYLGGFVRLQSVENPGAFLSFGAQWGELTRQWAFQGGVVLILLFTAWMLWKKPLSRVWVLGLSLILAGGIGNLIDRVWKDSVTDFLVLGFESLRTGVFNIADAAIILGMILILLPEKKPGIARR
ncbi:MAG: signal peptidase II [Bdellovibrionaceae bacterium]|nr:signal peptidase II [Pseudobdellovibrionaceae bacterium]MBX3033497.1 signal peptidase II [Pseudobdellovibrionaceae bacterium]